MRNILCVSDGWLKIGGLKCELESVLEHAAWHPKDLAEVDDSYRQLIPYMVIMTPDGKILTYRRAGSEGRLTGLHSIGIGGHIEESDETLENGRIRELKEELGLEPDDVLHTELLTDYIVLHETEVDRVHLGVQYTLTVAENSPIPTEEISAFEWLTVEQLVDLSLEGKLEQWSEVAFDRIALQAVRRAAKHRKSQNGHT